MGKTTLFIFAAFYVLINSCKTNDPVRVTSVKRDALFQYSVIYALQQGLFSTNEFTCGELKENGDLGIGTFNDLNGEMILMNDTVFQAMADGNVVLAPDSLFSPFATSLYFDSDTSFNSTYSGYDKLTGKLNGYTNQNSLYAFKISGNFDSITYRAVKAQHKPYPTLLEATQDQAVFTRQNISGSIVGFFAPSWLSSVFVPGFHFHFLSSDRNSGGHLLGFSNASLNVQIAMINSVKLMMPEHEDFEKMDFEKIDSMDIYKAEH